MDAVQTSAILLQTKATNDNIKSTDALAAIGVMVGAVSLAAQSKLDEAPFFGGIALTAQNFLGMSDQVGDKDFKFVLAIAVSILMVGIFAVGIGGAKTFLRRWSVLNWFGRVLDAAALVVAIFAFRWVNLGLEYIARMHMARFKSLLSQYVSWVNPDVVVLLLTLLVVVLGWIGYMWTLGSLKWLKRQETTFDTVSGYSGRRAQSRSASERSS